MIALLAVLSCGGKSSESSTIVISNQDCQGYCELVAGCSNDSVSNCTSACNGTFSGAPTDCREEGDALIQCLTDATCQSMNLCSSQFVSTNVTCGNPSLPLPPGGEGMCNSCLAAEAKGEEDDSCGAFIDPFFTGPNLECQVCNECSAGIRYRCAPSEQFVECQDGFY